MRPALLLLGVGAAFAGSYYGVRWYLSTAVPPDTTAQTPDVGDADAPAEPTPVEPAPASADAAPTEAPVAALTDASAPIADSEATVAPRQDAPRVDYRDPSQWTSGAPLPPRSGLLVVGAPTTPGHTVTVQIDARPAQPLPLSETLPEGMHAVRFIVDGRTRYRLATVRAGQAIVLQVPAGP